MSEEQDLKLFMEVAISILEGSSHWEDLEGLSHEEIGRIYTFMAKVKLALKED